MIRQTPNDQKRQTAVADVLRQRWDCEIIEREAMAEVDWEIRRGSHLVANAELKCRTCRDDKYDEVYLAESKYKSLIKFDKSMFIVRYENRIRWIWIKDVDPASIEIGGRNDREDDPKAQEPMIMVPIENMWKTGNKPRVVK